MIPILIVDDEAAIRESIAAMLRQRYRDRFSIHLAENGRQAIECAREHRIELILADIKMPVLSGLDMLDELRGCHCDCEVIFISGFDDYQFVRRAMKHGASDYLLKPVDQNDLYAQIDSFLKRWIPSSHHDAVPQAAWENPHFQQGLLEKLILHPDQTEMILSEYVPVTENSRLLAFALPVKDGEAVRNWQASLRSTFDSVRMEGSLLLLGVWRQMYLTLFLCPDASLLERLISPDVLPGALVRAAPVPPSRLGDCLNECCELLDHRFYNLVGEDGPEHYPYTQLISQITEAICQYRVDAFEELLALLMRRACAQFPPVESFRHILCAMVYTVMQQNTAFVPIISRMELSPDDLIRCIQSGADAAFLAREVPRIVRLQIQRIQARAVSSDAYHVERACQFIALHYAQNLSLTDLAESLALHPNYISSLFKKVRGMSFSQYLRHVRIQEACRLIRETNEKFYAIGEQVGYPDPVHFTRTFKEDMGCSPREYRRTHLRVEGDK